ncbi:MAG: YeeE/YedE thiosulfate transporter family protein, partial [Gemmobacter sp.]
MARAALLLLVLALAALALLAAGPRAMLLLLIGVGFGLVLEGLRFGFAGPWRLLVAERDARGFLAQLIAIGATAAVAIPLIAGAGGELQGAAAPVGIAMIAAAFVFGAAMQVVMGCGSGTLVNAGSGNLVGALA